MEAYEEHLRERERLNTLVRGQTYPFIAVIGNLQLEGIIPGNPEDWSDEDPNYYSNFITLLIYVSEDLTYNIESKNLLDAVDILFKICTVLKINFAPECGNIWSFLKEYIYGVEKNCCANYTNVIQFVKKNLMKTFDDLQDEYENFLGESNMNIDSEDD